MQIPVLDDGDTIMPPCCVQRPVGQPCSSGRVAAAWDASSPTVSTVSECELDRRALLRLGAAAMLLSACRSGGNGSSGPSLPDFLDPRPEPSPTPPPPPAPPTPYVPLPGEPIPNGKKVAADFVQALLTADRETTPDAAVDRALAFTSPKFDATAATVLARPLFTDAYLRGAIVYPQIGGLVPNGPGATTASVMVVARHTTTTVSGKSKDVVRTLDVRLSVLAGTWRVTRLVSVGGEPVDRPEGLDPRAARVLDDPRIELPDTARWDVHAGRVSLDLLDVLAAGAQLAPLSVAVLRSGHPQNVFGTERLSDHTRGRAVDVWRIGGTPVVSTGAATGAARQVLNQAFGDRRLSQAGSPDGSDLDGSRRRRSFTNLVHKDHLHLAVRGSSAAPAPE